MGVADFFNGVTGSVQKKTKSISESNNLKKKISYEKDRIMEIYAEIGEKFYHNQEGDHSDLIELCKDIDRRKNRIQSMKTEDLSINGKRICPKCKAVFNNDLTYCGKCGTKLIVFDSTEE